MAHLSTHILDTSRGRPAEGVVVILERRGDAGWATLGEAVTDRDGRAGNLLPPGSSLDAGDYRLTFAVAGYFESLGVPVFYPEVVVLVRLDGSSDRYHLPLLLNPFGYSTYRGS